MDETFRRKILRLLDQHRTTRIATLRSDGWPQVTTVGYANDGLVIYFLCGADSQKAANLAKDDRVFANGGMDGSHASDGHRGPIDGGTREARNEFPPNSKKPCASSSRGIRTRRALISPMPNTSEVCVFRLTPTIVSLLDYSKGFGHTDRDRALKRPHPALRCWVRSRSFCFLIFFNFFNAKERLIVQAAIFESMSHAPRFWALARCSRQKML